MAKGYNHHNHQLTKQTHYSKRSFLPLLCRASINDVKLPDFKDHSFSSVSGDPSSPKVSCMGQIKRNRKLLIPFTTPYKLTTSSSSATSTSTTTAAASIISISTGKVKYAYAPQKKLYSSQTFPTNVTTTTTTTGASGGREMMRNYVNSRRSSTSKIDNDPDQGNNNQTGRGYVRVNLKEMDPPLPVIKKPAPPPATEENLWSRRRSGGMALKSLTIQNQINLSNKNSNHSAPTV